MTTTTRATIEDLYHVPDNQKAELVDGEVVLMSPTGRKPGRAAYKIARSLEQHEETHGGGYAFADNVGFTVSLPRRESFSPDAAWHTGPAPQDDAEQMDFVKGAPAFAVEVRSKGDYGPAAEREMAAKRAEYFAAGTLVVWDADLLSADVIKKYAASDPLTPTVFRRGERANAEPAVPGWTLPVDDLFD